MIYHFNQHHDYHDISWLKAKYSEWQHSRLQTQEQHPLPKTFPITSHFVASRSSAPRIWVVLVVCSHTLRGRIESHQVAIWLLRHTGPQLASCEASSVNVCEMLEGHPAVDEICLIFFLSHSAELTVWNHHSRASTNQKNHQLEAEPPQIIIIIIILLLIISSSSSSGSSDYLSISPSLYVSLYLSISLSLPIHLSICLSLCKDTWWHLRQYALIFSQLTFAHPPSSAKACRRSSACDWHPLRPSHIRPRNVTLLGWTLCRCLFCRKMNQQKDWW